MFRHKIKELNLDGDKSNVEKILVVLEYETSSSNYAYKFSEIITVLIFGVLFSSILSSFLDKVDDWNVYIHCVKQISVGTLMLLVMFIYLDIFIFKGITLFFRNRNKRLIQTIHNYLIEN